MNTYLKLFLFFCMCITIFYFTFIGIIFIGALTLVCLIVKFASVKLKTKLHKIFN